MVESLRKLVSGNRRRFIENKVSLDLTYITPNIIAMSYPSSGFESLYRNPIEKVSISLLLIILGFRISQRKAWEQLLDHQCVRESNL